MKKLLLPLLVLLLFLSCEPFDLDRVEFVEVEAQITGVGNTTVKLSLNISGLTESQVDRSGFVWSHSNDQPTLDQNTGKKELGPKENGPFLTEIADLEADTRYVIAAYVVFAGKEIYSDTLSLTTGAVRLTIGEVQYVRGRSTVVTGTLMGLDLRDPVSQYGHCWSKTGQAPSLRNATCSNLGRPNADGVFMSTIDGLQRNETYYIRAYILTNFGTDTLYSENTLTYQTDLVDVWHEIAPFPGNGRSAATSFVIGDTAYVGLHSRIIPSPHGGQDRQFYAYAGKDWVPTGQLYRHRDIGLIPHFVIGDSVAYIGGLYTEDRFFYKYSPKTGVWSEVNAPGTNVTRRGDAVSFSIKGKGYVGLGIMEGRLQDFYEFDPVADNGQGQWAAAASLPDDDKSFTSRGAVTFVIKDSVAYVVNRGEVWQFRPEQGWERKMDFPDGSTNAGVGFAIGKRGYLCTGSEQGLLYSSILWEYNPFTDEWIRKADFPGDYRRFATGFAMNGKGYVGTGDFGEEVKQDFWEYTPERH